MAKQPLAPTLQHIRKLMGVREAENCTDREWLHRYGWAGLAAFKLATVLVVTGMVWVIARYRPRLGSRVLTFGCGTLADALNAAVASRKPGSRLREVLARSSFLVDATPVGRAARELITLDEGAVIEVLPPFAGG